MPGLRLQLMPTEDPNCRDDHDECEAWADVGECDRNPKFMVRCNLEDHPPCSDSLLLCLPWCAGQQCLGLDRFHLASSSGSSLICVSLAIVQLGSCKKSCNECK